MWVLAKEPAPGRVKTRLARTHGDAQAASLAWALLEDTLGWAEAACREAGAELWVSIAPAAPGERLRGLAERHGARLRPQGEGTLGERLARALGPEGETRVAVGMDAPDLDPGRVARVLGGLEGRRWTLGPAPDGGYYLVGLGAEVPAAPLAGEIRWSDPCTYADTVRAYAAWGAPEALPEHADVDDAEDLAALRRRLRESGAAPATSRWLAAHPE